MDYDDEETKEFLSGFAKSGDGSSAEDLMAAARKKITRMVVLAGLTAMALLVVCILSIFFSVRACMRRFRREATSGGDNEPDEATNTVDRVKGSGSHKTFGVTTF